MTDLVQHTSTMQDRITTLQHELKKQQTQIHKLQQQLKTIPNIQTHDIKTHTPTHSRYTSPSSEPQHSSAVTMTINKEVTGTKITAKRTTHNTDKESISANSPL